jgi:hypothetical protein
MRSTIQQPQNHLSLTPREFKVALSKAVEAQLKCRATDLRVITDPKSGRTVMTFWLGKLIALTGFVDSANHVEAATMHGAAIDCDSAANLVIVMFAMMSIFDQTLSHHDKDEILEHLNLLSKGAYDANFQRSLTRHGLEFTSAFMMGAPLEFGIARAQG